VPTEVKLKTFIVHFSALLFAAPAQPAASSIAVFLSPAAQQHPVHGQRWLMLGSASDGSDQA
jgi:hypothetical protein